MSCWLLGGKSADRYYQRIGQADEFLERELKPERLEAAAEAAGYPLQLHRHEGYDHGYYFIQSFIVGHLAHHAAILRG